jgi:hypothetical protein
VVIIGIRQLSNLRRRLRSARSNGGYNMPGYTYNLNAKGLGDLIAFLDSRAGHADASGATAAP